MSDAYDRDRAADAGLDLTKVDELLVRAAREIDEGLLPSCQLALARDGEVLVDVALGEATTNDRYVIFSCTKSLLAGAIWRLLGEGRLDIDATIASVIPEFASNGKDAVTLRMVLTHTGGFPSAPLAPPGWGDRAHRLERFAAWKLNWEPGSKFEYHPTAGHWVLAELVERVTGDDYRRYVRDELLAPLGLTRLQLGSPDGEPVDALPLRIVGELPTPDEVEAAIGLRLDLAELMGEVTNEAKLLFNDPEVLAVGVPGGGAVSTAADLAQWYQALLHNPAGLWSPEWLIEGTATVHCTYPDPILGFPSNRTLGLMYAGDDGTAAFRGFGRTTSSRAFGHNGAGGMIAWADPGSGLSFSYLTDGHDANVLRENRRGTALSSRAAVCAGPVG